jgi:hypothetical protein
MEKRFAVPAPERQDGVRGKNCAARFASTVVVAVALHFLNLLEETQPFNKFGAGSRKPYTHRFPVRCEDKQAKHHFYDIRLAYPRNHLN